MYDKLRKDHPELLFNEPAPLQSINEVAESLNIIFPQDYVEFLMYSNGVEGMIGENYLILWRIEELLELNEAYNADDFIPGLTIIGSNGGDIAYCIDFRSDNHKEIVSVPFIGMELDEASALGCFYDFILNNYS